ncbi:hypothetical protein HDC36_004621 [Xanthomonas sp. JAI131]|uniref:hypothetical protein n=1 Tax=Xanthomonas sp. JAI131 TaxID=2723067 RepID=UPI0015C6D891|nr:hypothetical protein [Xanthomonas sp. JAI131]NYF23131.1 hypothetical protein [Xanthomonas sp. JAI131]
MQAYDIALDDWRSGPPTRDSDGWCFGLPPGIRPAQWPLDPHSGYPMLHGFTLRLPADYRVHGADVVALSFFATSLDHNDGGPIGGPDGMEDVVDAPSPLPPDDAALLPFWERARQAHPRLSRMRDILGCAYAVILLSQDEADGPPCPPPPLVDSPLQHVLAVPQWFGAGAAAGFAAWERREMPLPEARDPHTVHRPFKLSARANDPNAGKPPREYFGDTPGDGDYQPFHYWLDGEIATENYREHDWAAGHAANHLGGTMRPVQNVPEFSPYYIGFEEEFGGYNFGGGNAQLDFKDMQFDWACG